MLIAIVIDVPTDNTAKATAYVWDKESITHSNPVYEDHPAVFAALADLRLQRAVDFYRAICPGAEFKLSFSEASLERLDNDTVNRIMSMADALGVTL